MSPKSVAKVDAKPIHFYRKKPKDINKQEAYTNRKA
jgi:hypothetical protein